MALALLQTIKLSRNVIIALASASTFTVTYLLYRWKYSNPEPLSIMSKAILTAMELKEEGNRLFRERKYEEAKDCYSRSLEMVDINDSTLRAILFSNVAAVWDCLNNFKATIDNASQAILLNPHYPKAYIRRATAYEKLNDLESYLYDLSASVILTGSTPENRQKIDDLITTIASENLEKSLKTRAIPTVSPYNIQRFMTDIFPDDIFSTVDIDKVRLEYSEHPLLNDYFYIIEIFKKGNIESGIEIISNILSECDINSLDPLQQRILLLRSTLYFSILVRDKTISDTSLLLRQKDITTEMKIAAHLRIVALYLHSMDVETALNALQEVRKLNPDRAHTSFFLGQVYLLLLNFDMAKHCTKRAMNLDINNINYEMQMLVIQANECKYQKNLFRLSDVLDEMREMCNRNVDNAEFKVELAQLLYDTKSNEESERLMNEALELSEEMYRPYVLTQKAMQSAGKNNLEEAELLLDESIALDANNETALQLKAMMAYKRNDIPDAIRRFNDVIDVSRGQQALLMATATILSLELQAELMKQLELPHSACSNFTSFLCTFGDSV